MPLYEELQQAAALIRQRAGTLRPTVGIILGSGLASFADVLQTPIVVLYQELPHFPQTSVLGHPGRLVIGTVGPVTVVAMQGRVHYYEGFSPAQVAFPARVLGLLGIHALVVTNAAGGIRTDLAAGDLMAIVDHINFGGWSPLIGPRDERFGPGFPDMSAAYDPDLTATLLRVARERRLPLKQGVYAMVTGPAYETPAEVRALRTLGADAVGMSTVPEVLVARQMGVRVVGISCITNVASAGRVVTHEEVAATAAKSSSALSELLSAFLPAVARS
jgi:purine-nucleoside phosphorylase